MSIALENVTKRYADQTMVDRVSLEVETGELFVLLGASGSGKSTLLRLIAGLVAPDEGTIRISGRDVTLLAPQQRDVGFVFQNYSIFRHMTVARNIEFGLRIRGVRKAERRDRREELLDLVGLGGLGNRFESQLSGGQQQRVALARALAYRPGVLLLDEPFGALDVKIRAQLRQSLKEIQKSLGVTTILVTHDQEEAFELGHRIGVVDRGRLLEVGAPHHLYERPRSLYVATFLGAGTVLVGRCRDHRVALGPLTLPIPPEVPHDEGDRVRVLIRPEQVALSRRRAGPGRSDARARPDRGRDVLGRRAPDRVRLPPLLGACGRWSPPLPLRRGERAARRRRVGARRTAAAKIRGSSSRRGTSCGNPRRGCSSATKGRGSRPRSSSRGRSPRRIDGVVTVLGVAADARRQDALREALAARAAQAGLPDAATCACAAGIPPSRSPPSSARRRTTS